MVVRVVSIRNARIVICLARSANLFESITVVCVTETFTSRRGSPGPRIQLPARRSVCKLRDDP